MKISLKNPETIRLLQKEIFPYSMHNGPFIRMFDNLRFTSEHREDVNVVCRQLVKDYSPNKENNVTREGWNRKFQLKLKNLGINPHDSLLSRRYWEYDTQMAFNIIFLISSGNYHSAIREMRFVLESFVHAFCVDKKYKLESLENKILKIEGEKTNKKELFTKTFQNYINVENLGIEMHNFYGVLCDKAHASFEELSDWKRLLEEYGKGINIPAMKYSYSMENLSDTLNTFSKFHAYLIRILDCF